MINHHLDGVEPVRFGEPDYVVHCNCGEGACILGVWYGYDGGFCGVRVDLISLADGASLDKLSYESPHFWPDIVPLDQLDILCLPWMFHYY